MVNHSNVIPDHPDATRPTLPTQWVRALWQWLSRPLILGLAGVLILLLFLGAALIQQMPGQIADDPAAATRWLLTVGEEYGMLGTALRTLGLFDVLHNPVLQLLLALLALILLVQLGSTVAALWRFWQTSALPTLPVPAGGAPIALPTTQPLYRLRQVAEAQPAALAVQLTQTLRTQFDELITATIELPAPAALPVSSEAGPVTEWRLLARRHHQPWIWLRPLLILGLLLALVSIWSILLAGWEITPPLLAPGDQYRATTQRVTLSYHVLEQADTLAPTLGVELADTSHEVPLGESSRLRLGQVLLEAKAGPPALWIRSNAAAVTLSQPGQAQNAMDLGLIFPTLGSEDSVVVENQVGLRIVRVAVLPEAVKANADTSATDSNNSPLTTAAHEQFLVEVYQPDAAKPVQTIVVSGPATAKIQVSGQVRELRFVPLPSMAAAVRYQPTIWLLWVALALVLVGAVGYRYRPAFVLLQLGPWPADRTVVVAQSDVAAELERLRRSLQ